MASAGSRTWSKLIALDSETRSECLSSIRCTVTPGRSVGTRKPRMLRGSSLPLVFAQTTATSAEGPFESHFLRPCSSQPPSASVASVIIPAGLLPCSGSVRPKQPITSPRAIRGSQCRFCASLPKARIGYITSELCTEANDRTPLSQRSSSCMIRPYITLLRPGPPYSTGVVGPRRPSRPRSGTMSAGNSPAK